MPSVSKITTSPRIVYLASPPSLHRFFILTLPAFAKATDFCAWNIERRTAESRSMAHGAGYELKIREWEGRRPYGEREDKAATGKVRRTFLHHPHLNLPYVVGTRFAATYWL
ncbi:hypothetical protein NMY22_g16219 [Coprinellus aureogranulatus]|nr:hypothetical protein NMY22_g16219 [Coprinellus aureogranulatus]